MLEPSDAPFAEQIAEFVVEVQVVSQARIVEQRHSHLPLGSRLARHEGYNRRGERCKHASDQLDAGLCLVALR